jgi:hypothetical protein
MNKTIFYNLFGSKKNQHFNIMTLLRDSYVEIFKTNEFNGMFSWNKRDDIYLSNIILKKQNFILTEISEISNKELNLMYTGMHIRNYKNDIISVKKDMICPKILKDMDEKSDSNIISCGCCKR